MTSTIEVIDTAVKIGFGALISGGATYLVTKLNHDKEIEKDQQKRRRDLLEEVSENVERFIQTLLKYRAKLNDWTFYAKSGKPIPEALGKELKELEENVPSAFNEIVSAERKLFLLNEIECQTLLRQFADFASEFTSKISEADANTIANELPEFRNGLLDLRKSFYESLSEIYIPKKPNTMIQNIVNRCFGKDIDG